MIYVSFILIALAGIFNSIMDTLQFHFPNSVFRGMGIWWNPEASWRLKWKYGNPEHGTRFPGSTTIFVFVTDAWHFFQFLMLSAFCLAIVLYKPASNWFWLDFIFFRLTFSLIFEISFNILSMKNQDGFFYAFGSWIKSNGVLATRLILVITFFASFGVYKLAGGDGGSSWGIPETSAVITIGIGLLFFFLTIGFVKK